MALAHIDCDAFYAAVEKRDDPSLRDQPLIIGGGARGVVSTACYIARAFGVRSAMPMFQARALCPDAIIRPPDIARYKAVARAIGEEMRALTPLVEPLSIDEAFLDLAGCETLHQAAPALVLARLAKRIEERIGISISIGLSYCKFLAKLASDMDKPRGFSIIGRAEAKTLLAPLSVGALWGVGKVAQAKLERAGLRRIGDLQRRQEVELIRIFGAEGQRLWRLAQAIDLRQVTPDRPTKSISAEITFAHDLRDFEDLAPLLRDLSEKAALRLKSAGLAGRSLTLKLKTSDFQTRTRAQSGLPPTQLAARIYPVARELLLKELAKDKRMRFRLIGIAMGDLCGGADADQPDLAEPDILRVKARESAIDALREKFGAQAVISAAKLKPRA